MLRGFYGGLTPESRNKLNRLAKMRSYHPGQIIYSWQMMLKRTAREVSAAGAGATQPPRSAGR